MIGVSIVDGSCIPTNITAAAPFNGVRSFENPVILWYQTAWETSEMVV